MGFAAVASARAGAAVAGARVAGPVGLATGAGRAGGATGVVAMTWISGSFVALELPLELEASCAATVLGAIASTAASAQSVPHTKMRPRCRWLNDTTYCPRACAIAMQALSNGVTVLTLAIGEVFQSAGEHLANLPETFGNQRGARRSAHFYRCTGRQSAENALDVPA
jgi:hypothetical protein